MAKMQASKENAKKALQTLEDVKFQVGNTLFEKLEEVQEFLQAAEKRLPSEAALAKDKIRKRPGTKPKRHANDFPLASTLKP